jgi:uncharacterized RmlC-like cupin family protein
VASAEVAIASVGSQRLRIRFIAVYSRGRVDAHHHGSFTL